MNRTETAGDNRIPVIDLFAGPGGLAEGFSAFPAGIEKAFGISLSIEKDPYAHSTLELRAFYRQFSGDKIPDDYYAYLRREITRTELFNAYPAGRNTDACAHSLGKAVPDPDRAAGTLPGRRNHVRQRVR